MRYNEGKIRLFFIGLFLKKAFCILSCYALCISLSAQSANSWINFNQEYCKISTAKDGIYRVSYSDLQAVGLSVTGDPRNIQIFHRGIEQPIIVSGEADGQFNTTDFIEFFGRRNDGKLDMKLYDNPASQPHTYYSLYNDTTSYFLTVGVTSGKRISLYSNNQTLSPETFHWDEKLMILTSQYSPGLDYGYIQLSTFNAGEGWMSNQILQTQTGNYTIAGIKNAEASSGKPQLEILLTGRGPMTHVVDISSGPRVLANITFPGFESYKHSQTLEWSDIQSNGELTINIKVLGSGGQPDRVSVNYIKVRYPQRLDMEDANEKVFIINKNSSGIAYTEIQRAPSGTRLFDITDPGSTYQLTTTGTTILNARVPSATTERTLLATNTFITPKLKRTRFRDLSNTTANFVIITHPSLRKPAVGYIDPVKAYGEYRASQQGGGYDTLILNIQQLYDQFNYGDQSPLAIKEFVKYVAAKKLPDYLLFIGKGLAVNYGYYRNPTAFTVYKDLVPTAGYPGSDVLFTAGINGTTYDPAVAAGRLSVSKSEEVAFYLNKVKETEARSFDDLRRKKILHLSGGIEEYQLEQFRLIMKEFESIGESFYFGADVTAASKQSTDIQLVNIAEELNKGLGFITFFGHSAPSTLDFDIGYVTNPIYGYKNKGKYPALLLNGCSAGDAFLYGEITGENWVNARDQGLVAFIAHSSFGFVNTLRNYTTTFYNVAFGDSVFINKGIGDVHKEVSKRYLNTFGVNDINITQAQQMVLQGDPALKLFPATKPDYEVDEAILTSFDGKEITALTDSLKLSFVVRNLGKAIKKRFSIQVIRESGNGKTTTYDSIFDPVLYGAIITFNISNNNDSYGNNTFYIKLDADDQLDELNENNNSYIIRYFIPLSGTKNLYPAGYSIASRQTIDLSFQSTDQLSNERDFLLEVDTTATFSSPYKKQFIIRGKVLMKQSLELLTNDSTVYFWRTKFAVPSGEESNQWNMSSFTYIEGSPPGWAQVDFAQFIENTTTGLVKDARIERLRFEETVTDVSLKTFGSAAGKPPDSISFKINNVEYNLYQEGRGCRDNTINLVAFDRKSTRPYVGLYFKWYEPGRRLICGREPFAINSFAPSELVTGNGDDMIAYVDNIFEGDSVLLFNIGNAGYQSWPAEAKAKLAEFGIAIAQIEQLADGEPVVIFGRKDAVPGSAQIFRLSDAGSPAKLSVNRSITGRYNAGDMTSVVIGPAKKWQRFIVGYSEAGKDDQVGFDITGINIDAGKALLKDNLTGDEDLTSIDAAEYPYLTIKFNTKDDISLKAAQLQEWLVLYEPVAEGILLYGGIADKEILAEGASHKMTYSFVNISESQFASDISVSYKLRNAVTRLATENSVTIPAPLPGDTVTFDLDVSTIGQAGENDLEVFANPFVLPELFYDNNVINLFKHLEVTADVTNPVLEVMIDGRYLANNDFVSPSPEIRIRLWDDNDYLKKADTVGLNVYLAYPCVEDACDFRRIAFSEPEMKWFAATDTSDFRLYFTPKNLPPGRYTLRVEAKDVTGNSSGSEPYSISFQVDTETDVIFSPPFPNPFSENVLFQFLVTGKTLPDYFRLRIYDLKGIMVKELTENDISRMFIGSNTILYQGDDSQKTLLPGGVFIYQLSLQNDGKMFTDYGKIVLAR